MAVISQASRKLMEKAAEQFLAREREIETEQSVPPEGRLNLQAGGKCGNRAPVPQHWS